MIVLGLDISTSCTGYCVIERKNKDNILLEAGAIKLDRKKDLYQKAVDLSNDLDRIIKSFNPSKIVVEENLQSFRPGMSSAKTILSLAKFNGITCYILYSTTGIQPESINVTTARNRCGLKISRKSSLDTKSQVLNFIKEQSCFNGFQWPKKTFTRGPREGKTVDDSSCFDIADSAIVAISSLIEQS